MANNDSMFKLVNELPNQLEQSALLPGLSELSMPACDFDRVVLCGMGGSAIAGDLIQPLLHWQKKPLTVWRDYELPTWVDERTLIISQSYSGNTEETLSSVGKAIAISCPMICISSGGQLTEIASGTGTNVSFPLIKLPVGLPPRASLGLGVGALVRIFSSLGMIQDPEAEIKSATKTLRDASVYRWSDRLSTSLETPACEPSGNISLANLAKTFSGKIPALYTAGHDAHAAGVRWKCQFNENSKLPAFLASFPELNHNDLVGWELPEELSNRMILIIIRGDMVNDRIAARVTATKDLLSSEFFAVHEICAIGDTILARIMSLVQYGDFLSCYLADLADKDPMPVVRIDRLKSTLAEL